LGTLTLIGLIILIIGLIIFWIIVSIPVYIAGKVMTGGKSSLGDAMVATLFGPIVYVIVLFAVDFFLGTIIGSSAYIWAFILAFMAWLWVYKSSFNTGWLVAVGIAVLAVVVFVIINIVFGQLFGIHLPVSFFP